MGNFNILPSEIVLEILSRVPTESVLKCKSVSKPWRSLLKHPSFSRLHLNHLNDLDSAHDSDGKLSLILYTVWSREAPYYYTEYDETLNRFTRKTRINVRPPSACYYILGSCNGLICFNASHGKYYPQPYYVCNPITREYIVLPEIYGTLLLSGFGYSPSTNEYKAVRICKSKRDPNYGIIQVYTLGSGIGWRNGRKMDYDVISFISRGVFANGSIHWVNSKGTIVAFDLADEEFRQLPSLPWLSPVIVQLHVLGDFLCASDSRYGGDCDIWVFKKNISNHDMIWSKEYSNISVTPIGFSKSGGLLGYDYRDKNVYLYPSKASSFRILVNWYNYCDKNFYQHASSSRMLVNFGEHFNLGVPHKNTLMSLKSLGEDDTKLMDQVKEQDRMGRQKTVIIGPRKKRKKMISR